HTIRVINVVLTHTATMSRPYPPVLNKWPPPTERSARLGVSQPHQRPGIAHVTLRDLLRCQGSVAALPVGDAHEHRHHRPRLVLRVAASEAPLPVELQGLLCIHPLARGTLTRHHTQSLPHPPPTNVYT